MSRYLLICLFLISSCSFLVKNDTLKKECNEVNIVIENNSIEDKLFNSNLELSLKERFGLLFDKNRKIRKVNQDACYLKVKVNRTENSVITSSSGNTSRVNRKIKVNYIFKSKNNYLDREFIVFYGSDVSRYVYSDYIKNKKEEKNNIKIITDRLYSNLLNNI